MSKIDNSVLKNRSIKNLSCNWTGSADFGRLIPFHWEELLQGDKIITCKPRIELQCLPLASPTFGKIDLYVHYFIVPIRLLQKSFYDTWSKTGYSAADTLSYVKAKEFCTEYARYSTALKRTLFKHWTSMGLPPFFELPDTDFTDETPISLYPFFAYNRIWWDFYRDPEVVRDESETDYLTTDTYSGEFHVYDGLKYCGPHLRSIKDNWIANLYAQSGDFVTQMLNNQTLPFDVSSSFDYFNANGDQSNFTPSGLSPELIDTDVESTYPSENTTKMLRLIESLNRFSERLSLSGKRQIEALYARYGLKPNWAQMSMSRYVGGGKATVLVDNIISTADTTGSPLGAKAGTAQAFLNNVDIQCSVDEPSILMGVLSVMPHVHFVQGISKKWQRKDLQDMFQSSLQYVGEVAIAKREVGVSSMDVSYPVSANGETFAYSLPYYEYSMGLDVLAGDFMKYHKAQLPADEETKKNILFMQSMEQYVDYHQNRTFNIENLQIDGDQYNKIFYYLGGAVNEDVDDHFHLCIDKDVKIERPIDGSEIPTLETTQNPHQETQSLSNDTVL